MAMAEMGPSNLDILLELHVMATMYRHRTGYLLCYRLYHLYVKKVEGAPEDRRECLLI